MNPALTSAQEDALHELIKMGYGRAAAALSDLTRQELMIELPTVSVHPIDEIGLALGRRIHGEVICVNQVFTGPITGDAFLLLDRSATTALSDLLLDPRPDGTPVPEKDRQEVITEVGNILLNACLGALGNLLKVQLAFAVPQVRVEAIDHTMRSLSAPGGSLAQLLMMHTRFHGVAGKGAGNLVLLLGFMTLDQLLAEIAAWDRQANLG